MDILRSIRTMMNRPNGSTSASGGGELFGDQAIELNDEDEQSKPRQESGTCMSTALAKPVQNTHRNGKIGVREDAGIINASKVAPTHQNHELTPEQRGGEQHAKRQRTNETDISKDGRNLVPASAQAEPHQNQMQCAVIGCGKIDYSHSSDDFNIPPAGCQPTTSNHTINEKHQKATESSASDLTKNVGISSGEFFDKDSKCLISTERTKDSGGEITLKPPPPQNADISPSHKVYYDECDIDRKRTENVIPLPQCKITDRNDSTPKKMVPALVPLVEVERACRNLSGSENIINDRNEPGYLVTNTDKKLELAGTKRQKMFDQPPQQKSSKEYEVCIPTTPEGLMIRVGEIQKSVVFLAYRRFEDGSMGPAETRNLVRNPGDKLLSIDGTSTLNKNLDEVCELMRKSSKQRSVIVRFLESYATFKDGEGYVNGLSVQSKLSKQINDWVTNTATKKSQSGISKDTLSQHAPYKQISASGSNEKDAPELETPSNTAACSTKTNIAMHKPSTNMLPAKMPCLTQPSKASVIALQTPLSQDPPQCSVTDRKRKNDDHRNDDAHDSSSSSTVEPCTEPETKLSRNEANSSNLEAPKHPAPHLSKANVSTCDIGSNTSSSDQPCLNQPSKASMIGSQKTLSNELPHCHVTGRKRKHVDYRDGGCSQFDNDVDDSYSSSTAESCKEPERKHDNLLLMHEVEHLSRTEVDNETGLPNRLFTVMDLENETLYDFKVDIGTSLIPNSGYGAFLTFLGARILRPQVRKRSNKILANRIAHMPTTMLPLRASIPDGSTMRLTLTGKNLHGNDNSIYWPESTIPLVALRSNGDKVRTKLKCDSIYSNKDKEENTVVAARKKCKGRGLGCLEMFSESDYMDDNGQEFCSHSDGCGLIDLGRYGPLHKDDRKIDVHFDLKNFIFDFEPAAWNFGVSEKIRGRKQIIDITDDATGEPHFIAKQNIPMYVNEVGHDKNLRQNVVARDKDERVVHYYFHQDMNMKKGQTVELLVDYLHAYEETRERKGYGKANFKSGVKGDGDDRSRLKRNFVDRALMKEDIQSMSFSDMVTALRFIRCSILKPVITATDWFIEHSNEWISLYKTNKKNGIDLGNFDAINILFPMNPPHWRQWVARRRMHWLGGKFRSHFDNLLKKASPQWLSRNKKDINFINKTLDTMEWNTMYRMIPFIRYLRNKDGKTLLQMMFDEISEEVLYFSSGQLVRPYDESLWCPIAMRLTRQSLRTSVASFLVTPEENERAEQHLAEALFKDASSAAFQIRKVCKHICRPMRDENTESAVNALSFQSAGDYPGALHHPFLTTATGVVGDKNHANSDLDGTRNPNKAVDTSENARAYQDTIGEKGSSNTFGIDRYVFGQSKAFIITNPTQSTVGEQKGASFQTKYFSGVAQHIDLQQNTGRDMQSIVANKDYYLLFQVVLVVHAIASSTLEGKRENHGHKFYSLEKLCTSVGVNPNHARAIFYQTDSKKTAAGQENLTGNDGKLAKLQSSRREKSKDEKKGNIDVRKEELKSRNEKQTRQSSHKVLKEPAGRIDSKSIFLGTLWKGLEALGWHLEYGKRQTDCYFMPPGTKRGEKGSRHRVDYFDSTKRLMDFITSDTRWKHRQTVLKAIKLHDDCIALYSDLRAAKQISEHYTVDMLVEAVKSKNKNISA